MHGPALCTPPIGRSTPILRTAAHWPKATMAEGGAEKGRGSLWSPWDSEKQPSSSTAIWSKWSQGHSSPPLLTVARWPSLAQASSLILLISFPVELFGPQWRSSANKAQGFKGFLRQSTRQEYNLPCQIRLWPSFIIIFLNITHFFLY